MKRIIALAAVLAVTLGLGAGIATNDLGAGNSLKRAVHYGNSL